MSSHICLRVHFIWSTAHHQPLIDAAWEARLFGYLGAVLGDRGGALLAAGAMPEHLHLYGSLPATLALADLVNALKANSSRWIHQTLARPEFAWQNGYGAFSVSPSADRQVRRYIANQKAHHHRQSFEAEYLAFLKRHEVPYDPRYVFA
jgi:putative transposase